METAYLLLGTNEGVREKNLQKAKELIEKECGKIIRCSSVYETEAWGLKEQNSFLNEAVCISTSLAPATLLASLKYIETEVGRTQTVKWGPRVIDIDILFYGNEVVAEVNLKVPHAFITERRFTLVPLNEIAAEFVHPVLKKTMNELLKECKDESEVNVFVYHS
jgi:2-amino-4-hydroxy-6-hydroxymethyldihydropteridine diphosphokinase